MASPDAKTDLLWFLGIFALVGLVWFFTGGPNNPEARTGPFISPPAPLGGSAINRRPSSYSSAEESYQTTNTSGVSRQLRSGEVLSPWAGQIKIGVGNARYEIQPNNEYISLEANHGGINNINITGWRLTNGRDQRYYPAGLGERPGVSEMVVIPAGVKFFVGGGANAPVDPILLAPGDRAILTTGHLSNSSPYPVTVSFRTNFCFGYIDQLDNYYFTPSVPNNCPDPSRESGIERLDDDCFDYVDRLSSCHTPKFDRDREGLNLIDGRRDTLSGRCRDYLVGHFNYNACLVNHSTDANFYGHEWRIFLNRTWQLWDDSREVISLYDSQGRLVDRVSY